MKIQDITEGYGRYYCSTDKKWKTRKGPKQTRKVSEGYLKENASKLLSAEDRNGVITVIVQAPDGTKRSLADANPRYINKWLMKYDLTLPRNIMSKFVESVEQGVAEGANADSQIKRIKDRILQLKDWNTAGTHDKKIKELQAKLKELQKQGVAEGNPIDTDWYRKQQERQTKAKQRQQGVAEEKTRLDPKCWDGYKKDGTKMKGGVRVNNCVKEELEETYDGDEFFEAYGELWYNEDEQLDEADYQGRSVPLGKPMQGDVKKFKVYVKDPSTGNVKKVNFGDPDMKIRKSNPAARRSFRARHNCDNPGPRTKARYWSCRKW